MDVAEHPFYGSNARLLADPRTRAYGLASMAAYLAFWAGVVALGMRELNRRFPPTGPAPDTAVAVLRGRYASGAIDREQFRTMLADLNAGPQ